MTLETFNSLSIDQKGNIVFGKDASFLGIREYYGQKLVLYDCGEFFAETWYDPENNEITKIEGFPPNDKRLDRYIDAMKKIK
jgi:hypothetical protein